MSFAVPNAVRTLGNASLALVMLWSIVPSAALADAPSQAPLVAPSTAAAPSTTPSTAQSPSPAAPSGVRPMAAGGCPSPGNLLRSATLTATEGAVTGTRPRVNDGILAMEGTPWSAPDAVVLRDVKTSLTFDLGTPRQIRGLAAQGDNNDEYNIESSLDGVSYKLAWIVPVTEVGQGLRTRSTVLPKPVEARYLRLTPRGGDNFYSISEVQAVCQLSPAFPPKLRTPPVKFGWDALDNDRMVFVKGILATFAFIVLALAWWPKFREQRVRRVMWRVLIAGLPLLAAGVCAVLGYALSHGPVPGVPQGLLNLARVRGSVPGFYYSAGVLALCGLALFALCVRRGGPRGFDLLLASIGVLSFLSWWNLGHYHFDHYIHTWEHYHYIMGAKYGPELRYAHLYQCTATADAQDGLRARVKARKMRRIESDNELGTTEAVLKNPNLCLDRFKANPARYEQFRKDLRFFRSKFGRDRWDQSQQDHGYNATPVWAIAGRLIADRVELTWDNIVKLGIIDSVYLIAMWLAVLWAFGWRSASVAAIWWGTNFPARFYWNGGSFLRYDWILWMVLGLCFLRKKRMFLGGVALTYGTLLRVFPGFLIAALVLKALAQMVDQRRIFLSRAHMYFAAGCITALAVLIPTSSWATNGLDAWGEFAVNSKKHLATALTNNMGFKTVMGYDFDTRAAAMRNDKLEDPFEDWKSAKQHFYKVRAPYYYAILLLFMFMLARATLREEEEWAAACLGAGLIVMGAELTCYYWGFLLPLGLLWERRKLPGVLLTALSAFTCFIYGAVSWNDDHFAAMSLGAAVVVIAVTAQAAFGKRVPPVSDEPPAPSVPPPTADAFGPASPTPLPVAPSDPR